MGAKPTKNLKDAPVCVVVGGGPAGITVARALDDKLNVVLVDRTDFFFHNVGVLRACVQPEEYVPKIVIPYSRLLKNGHFVQGECESISDSEIKLKDVKEGIKFDYLCICTGSAYAFPFKVQKGKKEAQQKVYEQISADIKEAKKIVIVGGGPVGIELAGEIQETHEKKKDVTIVHGSKLPMSDGGDYVQKFREKVKSELEAMDVKCIFEDRLVFDDDIKNMGGANYLKGERELKLKSGKTLKCDLLFLCTGSRVNSASFEEMKESVDNKKQLVVNNKGQVRKNMQDNTYYDNIFGMGDCTNWGDNLAYWATQQGPVVAKNIMSHVAKKPMAATWKNPDKPVLMVPVGMNRGAGQFGSYTVGRRVVKAMKGKGLFIKEYWKAMGYPNILGRKASEEDEKKEDVDKKAAGLMSVLNVSDDQAKQLAVGVEASDDPEKVKT